MGEEARKPTNKPDSPWNKKSIVNRRVGGEDLLIDETPSIMITKAYFPEDLLDKKDVIGNPIPRDHRQYEPSSVVPVRFSSSFLGLNLNTFPCGSCELIEPGEIYRWKSPAASG